MANGTVVFPFLPRTLKILFITVVLRFRTGATLRAVIWAVVTWGILVVAVILIVANDSGRFGFIHCRMISVTVSVFITEAVGVRSLCRNVIDQFRILRIDGLDAKRSVFVRGAEERIFVDSESLDEFFGNVVGKF